IYALDKGSGEWVLLRDVKPPFIPPERYSVVYFDNTKCPACRKYDIYWYPFVKACVEDDDLRRFGFYIVLCEWFSGRCDSREASETFTYFGIHASPTTIFFGCEGGEVIHHEKYEGVLTEVELTLIIKGFRERVDKARKGEKVEPPLKREDNLIDLLRKLLGGA
ncbi:MAG: hypothetical protein J7L55_01770, partial [Desulfurococcales archaeon]|nr:hypothetical protein [Desulfurococcales archaeon]